MRIKSRRRAAAGSLALALIAVLGGCDLGGDSGGNSPSANAPAPTERDRAKGGDAKQPAPARGPGEESESWDPIELAGTGSETVEFEIPDSSPAIVRFTHDDSGLFQATSYTAEGDYIAYLTSSFFSYEGIRPVNFQGPPAGKFEINAEGEWTATIEPLSEIPEATVETRGGGDAVLRIADLNAATVNVRHSGSSNFQVSAWSEEHRKFLINEIGMFDSRVDIPPDTLFLEIVADGSWRLDFDS